jgi:hypothetical protein
MSVVSTQASPADLTLKVVAFARLSEGHVVSRGTARQLDYRRQGGVLQATDGTLVLEPKGGTGLAAMGTLRLSARSIEGETQGRKGSASGQVTLQAARGDRGTTERIDYDGAFVKSSTPVTAQGPGYRVAGGGLLATTDGSRIELTNGARGALELEAHR